MPRAENRAGAAEGWDASVRLMVPSDFRATQHVFPEIVLQRGRKIEYLGGIPGNGVGRRLGEPFGATIQTANIAELIRAIEANGVRVT